MHGGKQASEQARMEREKREGRAIGKLLQNRSMGRKVEEKRVGSHHPYNARMKQKSAGLSYRYFYFSSVFSSFFAFSQLDFFKVMHPSFLVVVFEEMKTKGSD